MKTTSYQAMTHHPHKAPN